MSLFVVFSSLTSCFWRIVSLAQGVRPVTLGTSELAARLFNATGRRGASTANCFIAASALEVGAVLLMADVHDFAPFVVHGLKVIQPTS